MTQQGMPPGGAQQGIPFRCQCGRQYVIPPAQQGQEFRCPDCLAVIRPRDYMAQAATTTPRRGLRARGPETPAKPPTLPGVFACKCGYKFPLPQGPIAEDFRCPECLAIIHPRDIAAAQGQRPAQQAPARAPAGAQHPFSYYLLGTNPRETVLAMVKWSVMLAVLMGPVLALLGALVVPRFMKSVEWRGPAMVGSYFGALLGLLLASVFVLVRKADMHYALALFVGALIGLALSMVHYVIDLQFITIVDAGIIECAAMGAFSGAVTGSIALMFKEE